METVSSKDGTRTELTWHNSFDSGALLLRYEAA
jgi:hypothetical protein